MDCPLRGGRLSTHSGDVSVPRAARPCPHTIVTALQLPFLDVDDDDPEPVRARVLVVDDDGLLRRLLRDALLDAGFAVIEAVDGRDALERLESVDVDLVLLDAQLPRLTGYDVLHRLRSHERTRTLPVILVTADDSVAQRVSGLAAGADDYVTKPFSLEEVVARVSAAFRAHEAWRRTLQMHERHRAELSKALAGAARQETLEGAAAVLCNAIAGQHGVRAAALVRFTADQRCVTLARGGPGVDVDVSGSLLERAQTGPWVERDPLRVCAPLEGFGGVAPGVLVAQLDERVVDVATGLAAAIDCAAAISGLLLPHFEGRRRSERDGADLRSLLSEHAFEPHFQPIVDLRTDEVVGAEALTRFADGSSPDSRFSEASALGFGIELELATLSAAVTTAHSLAPATAWLSLNVSPELMVSPAYERVRDVLDVRDRDVVLELSERQLVTDYDAVRSALRSTGDGVRWSIDDAGSGFASLRHILRLDPAFIKLDRSWVEAVDTDPAKQAMIAGLCHFADQTGAQLIAEGIETTSERDVLDDLGVPLGQGFLLGRPEPVST